VRLIRSHGIPNQQLTVLRGGNQTPGSLRPMHGVDLSQMALQHTARTQRSRLRERRILSGHKVLELRTHTRRRQRQDKRKRTHTQTHRQLLVDQNLLSTPSLSLDLFVAPHHKCRHQPFSDSRIHIYSHNRRLPKMVRWIGAAFQKEKAFSRTVVSFRVSRCFLIFSLRSSISFLTYIGTTSTTKARSALAIHTLTHERVGYRRLPLASLTTKLTSKTPSLQLQECGGGGNLQADRSGMPHRAHLSSRGMPLLHTAAQGCAL